MSLKICLNWDNISCNSYPRNKTRIYCSVSLRCRRLHHCAQELVVKHFVAWGDALSVGFEETRLFVEFRFPKLWLCSGVTRET